MNLIGNKPSKNKALQQKDYRIVFFDSGVGGLIFALDALQELEPKLQELQKKYGINFIFHHFGDSKNAPYGNKSADDVKKHTKHVLQYLLDLDATYSAVIACNTTSAIYDEEMVSFFAKKCDTKIITLVEESSKTLALQANKQNKIHLAILATPTTINSNSYQNEIAKLTKNQANLYCVAPKNWVKNIENSIDEESENNEIYQDLKSLQNQAGQSFKDILAIGLFCTHYPFYKNKIAKFFDENGNKNVKILTQGNIFAKKIYADILENIKKYYRSQSLENKGQRSYHKIKIISEISGKNLEESKKVIAKTHPKYFTEIDFKINNID